MVSWLLSDVRSDNDSKGVSFMKFRAFFYSVKILMRYSFNYWYPCTDQPQPPDIPQVRNHYKTQVTIHIQVLDHQSFKFLNGMDEINDQIKLLMKMITFFLINHRQLQAQVHIEYQCSHKFTNRYILGKTLFLTLDLAFSQIGHCFSILLNNLNHVLVMFFTFR